MGELDAAETDVYYALRMKEMGANDIRAFNLDSGAPRAGDSGDGQGWWLYMDVRQHVRNARTHRVCYYQEIHVV